jgi:hypothetical protein
MAVRVCRFLPFSAYSRRATIGPDRPQSGSLTETTDFYFAGFGFVRSEGNCSS